MWNADVTSSQRSPGFGATSALENSAFSYVLRERRSMISRDFGDAETFEDGAGIVGFPGIVRNQIRAAAGEDDARIRIAARKRGGGDDAVGRVRTTGVPCAADRSASIDAAEHDDAVGRTARGIPRRKARLQRIEQQIAERRKAAEREQQRPP